jgi:hypothetical protein
MNLSIHLHSTWLNRPTELRNQLAALAALEAPFPGSTGEPGDDQTYPPDRFDKPETSDPERHAPARPTARPDRGDAWEPPTTEPDEDAPTDGRQLLGWASKQVPDLKGVLIGYGKKKGLHSKIVEWTPQQVTAAYRFARGRQFTTR